MIIKFYFSQTLETFYNKYPDEKRTPDESYVEIGELESRVASDFVWYMVRHRFKGYHLTLEFVKEKLESYLLKYGKDGSENESTSEGIVSR